MARKTSISKHAVHEHIRHMLTIERLCSRFPHVANQLLSRHENRSTIKFEDEYDVRDLLHALLILEFDDVRSENWIPDYAGGKIQVDFLLKLEKIIIVVKMTRSDFGAKELEEQLVVDIQKYKQHTDCRTLVCFVYDPNMRIADPRTIESRLIGYRNGFKVRVIITPNNGLQPTV